MSERSDALEEAARIADEIAEGWEASGSAFFHAKEKAAMARFVAYAIRSHSRTSESQSHSSIGPR